MPCGATVQDGTNPAHSHHIDFKAGEVEGQLLEKTVLSQQGYS